MPTKTPPDFEASERPTEPDIGARCPECKGNGDQLVDISETANPRMVRRQCGTCWGKRFISREDLARYLARKGRP